jgi:hypothetical protein
MRRRNALMRRRNAFMRRIGGSRGHDAGGRARVSHRHAEGIGRERHANNAERGLHLRRKGSGGTVRVRAAPDGRDCAARRKIGWYCTMRGRAIPDRGRCGAALRPRCAAVQYKPGGLRRHERRVPVYRHGGHARLQHRRFLRATGPEQAGQQSERAAPSRRLAWPEPCPLAWPGPCALAWPEPCARRATGGCRDTSGRAPSSVTRDRGRWRAIDLLRRRRRDHLVRRPASPRQLHVVCSPRQLHVVCSPRDRIAKHRVCLHDGAVAARGICIVRIGIGMKARRETAKGRVDVLLGGILAQAEHGVIDGHCHGTVPSSRAGIPLRNDGRAVKPILAKSPPRDRRMLTIQRHLAAARTSAG